mmetsp:Transcript_45031/g.104301  ORF Transcript_45031/g.104301 Transcript_45031/m.104301 type:complete len:300 (+) Transcript_45031:232-1131(+)
MWCYLAVYLNNSLDILHVHLRYWLYSCPHIWHHLLHNGLHYLHLRYFSRNFFHQSYGNLLDSLDGLRFHTWDWLVDVIDAVSRHLCEQVYNLHFRNLHWPLLVDRMRHFHEPLLGLNGHNPWDLTWNLLHLCNCNLRDAFCNHNFRHRDRNFLLQHSVVDFLTLCVLHDMLGNRLVDMLHRCSRHVLNQFSHLYLWNFNYALLVDNVWHLHDFLDILNDLPWHRFVNVAHLHDWLLLDHFTVLNLGDLESPFMRFYLRNFHDSFNELSVRPVDLLLHLLQLRSWYFPDEVHDLWYWHFH